MQPLVKLRFSYGQIKKVFPLNRSICSTVRTDLSDRTGDPLCHRDFACQRGAVKQLTAFPPLYVLRCSPCCRSHPAIWLMDTSPIFQITSQARGGDTSRREMSARRLVPPVRSLQSGTVITSWSAFFSGDFKEDSNCCCVSTIHTKLLGPSEGCSRHVSAAFSFFSPALTRPPAAQLLIQSSCCFRPVSLVITELSGSFSVCFLAYWF